MAGEKSKRERKNEKIFPSVLFSASEVPFLFFVSRHHAAGWPILQQQRFFSLCRPIGKREGREKGTEKECAMIFQTFETGLDRIVSGNVALGRLGRLFAATQRRAGRHRTIITNR
jgi:hypothetical protein